ncbi:MAG: high-potential iron-sulfur protein [Rhodoferax sp.]|uniref:high-potential iron-sulfur protein n=1 Tax=Rhodoferax sp. TaxID=50421 RepID=UPI00262C67D2|nr:high-potential iron-sulfur protein [Rhodoferax sp.]MDD2880456.1 high-potential iron-sulfur protein [Rhodoferax sp.]
MSAVSTRRRFIEIMPFAGVALLAACSPKVEPPPAVVNTPAPPPVAATPAPTPPVVQEAAPAASAMPLVDETAAQAVALGYVANHTRADTVKFKSYVVGNQCSTCALYLGKAGDAEGPCPLFPGKHVAAVGWCNSWVKKA